MNQNKNIRSDSDYGLISIIKFMKWTYIPYLFLLFLAFMDSLVNHPRSLLEAIKLLIYASGWGYLIISSPFILVIAGIEYFLRQTNLTNIPKDTTLYEAITQPTMMYGPMKMILSKLNEETETK